MRNVTNYSWKALSTNLVKVVRSVRCHNHNPSRSRQRWPWCQARGLLTDFSLLLWFRFPTHGPAAGGPAVHTLRFMLSHSQIIQVTGADGLHVKAHWQRAGDGCFGRKHYTDSLGDHGRHGRQFLGVIHVFARALDSPALAQVFNMELSTLTPACCDTY